MDWVLLDLQTPPIPLLVSQTYDRLKSFAFLEMMKVINSHYSNYHGIFISYPLSIICEYFISLLIVTLDNTTKFLFTL